MANKKRDEPVIRVTVGLDQSDHDQLSRIATSAGVSLAWMMRRAIGDFIERVAIEHSAVGPLVSSGNRLAASNKVSNKIKGTK